MRWAINACVLLLLIPGAVHLDSDVLNAEAIAEYFGYGTDAVLATDIGEHREATLHGGAQITLNSGTAVRMRSTRQYQEAALESGEVLVTVTRESSRRVGVVAGDVAIEATQARYSVRKLASGAYMARVYDGEVTIAPHVDRRRSLSSRAAFQPVRVGRGRAADIQPGRVALSAFDADDAPRLLSWTAGFLVFKGETLGEAAEEFNRYNRQQIVVADKALRRAQVGGWFDATNPEGFARAVAQMFGVHVTSIRSGGRGATSC